MALTVVAFLVALAILIAVHEYGHYRVARACGVKVLRFSIGFGKPLLRWQPKGSPTEYVIGMFPLGGYVKMLDEREGPVAPEERHLAFNNRPLGARAAIVAAGPLANLVLAVLLYALVNWVGVMEPAPYLARPAVGTVAAQAGVQGGERVLSAAMAQDAPEAVRSFDDLRWLLARGALDGRNVRLTVRDGPDGATHELTLRLDRLDTREPDTELLKEIGLTGPWTRPVIGEVMPQGAAEREGLQPGDVVLRIGAQAVADGQQLRTLIRASVSDGAALTQTWRIERAGQVLELAITPDLREEDGVPIGRIGAYVGAAPEMLMVRYGPLEGLWKGGQRTWEVSALTLRMMGRMVIGEASVKNLSGPLTIADFAGKSAHMGFTAYLVFLALVSVSLGVLNLLPLPVLDGGHLMYYLWEGVTGRGVSDAWMERLQRGGVALLLVMMSIAVFNDFTRLFG
jgi:regulator of sigma E protease